MTDTPATDSAADPALDPATGDGAERTRLFPDPPGDEPVWDVTYGVQGKELSISVWRSLIRTEMIDQTEIRSSHRKAILRKTEKALTRAAKIGFSKLNEEQLEQTRWNAFIVMVAHALGNNALKVREDESLVDELIDQSESLAQK